MLFNLFTFCGVIFVQFLKNVEKGVEILRAAVEKDKVSYCCEFKTNATGVCDKNFWIPFLFQNNSRLRLQLIDLYMNQTPVNEEAIVKVMDEVIDQESEVEKKLLFAQRKLEFLEEFSENSIS